MVSGVFNVAQVTKGLTGFSAVARRVFRMPSAKMMRPNTAIKASRMSGIRAGPMSILRAQRVKKAQNSRMTMPMVTS